DDINVVYVDTFKIAHDGGNPKGTNVVMLGAIVQTTGIISMENAKKALAYSFKAKPKLIDINLKMFDLGCESVK
ncbi:MAG: 2-oxoacid:acceptor oxidoreductase family protein, partial [Clostridia bacterium]|nr:2-oxoacid:acceptor oxidoreductase family protein [Clostridia bacterium]